MSTLHVLFVQGADVRDSDVGAALRDAGYSPQVERVSDPDALRLALHRRKWDLVVSDHRFEDLDTFATLAILSQTGLDIPVIAVAGDLDQRTAVRLMRAGAQDYVHVGRLHRLGPIVERELLQTRANHEREQTDAQRREAEVHLAQALKMESIGRLAGGVAHDFNNLLTLMIGSADLARTGLSEHDAGLREAFDEILSAGDSARHLVSRLLAVGRQQPLDVSPIDLNAVVTETVADLRATLPATIDLTTSLTPDLSPVDGDAPLLGKVLMSLAANARDAMGTSGRLRVETSNVQVGEPAEVPPGTYVLLAVVDSGPGMDAETSARIFDPFFSTKEPGLGAGLGLSAVYGIVQQHGGHVRVQSDPGHGSTFNVYLPCATRGPTSTPTDAETQQHPAATTVMVIEDERTVRSLVSRMLASQGYRVVEAEDGAAAIKLATELPSLDLVVTDVVMPGLTGPQTRERITMLHPGCRVLFISGYPDNVLGEHAIPVAGLPFLKKPFTVGELTAKVRQVLADA